MLENTKFIYLFHFIFGIKEKNKKKYLTIKNIDIRYVKK